MPRNPPSRVRATLRRRRGAVPAVAGLSAGAHCEILRLERARNHLSPGDVARAVHRWKSHVALPSRELWHSDAWGDVHWYCCGNPLEARALLDAVQSALSPRGARELRRVVDRIDARLRLRNGPAVPGN
ncbi:hypothetical protein [Kitasatospora sp. NPDC088134]|uniref:hypothetical protein n=1 Tax=Kitasatospora sp. NPDC088134 TaxID=3364071 RepID=UPI0037FAA5B1